MSTDLPPLRLGDDPLVGGDAVKDGDLIDTPPPAPTDGPDELPRTIGGKRSSINKIKDRLEREVFGFGLMVAAINEADGKAIMEGAEALADSLAAWAQDSPRIRKFLEASISGSHAINFLGAAATIIVPIMRNHNLLPDFAPFMFAGPQSPNGNDDADA